MDPAKEEKCTFTLPETDTPFLSDEPEETATPSPLTNCTTVAEARLGFLTSFTLRPICSGSLVFFRLQPSREAAAAAAAAAPAHTRMCSCVVGLVPLGSRPLPPESPRLVSSICKDSEPLVRTKPSPSRIRPYLSGFDRLDLINTDSVPLPLHRRPTVSLR